MNLTMKSLTLPVFYFFCNKFFRFDSPAMLLLSSHCYLPSCWGWGLFNKWPGAS